MTTLNPPLALTHALVIAAAFAFVLAWFSWMETRRLPRMSRSLVRCLRVIAIVPLCVVLLNPGRWIEEELRTARECRVLLDRSASMAAEDGRATRWEHALQTGAALESSATPWRSVRLMPFSMGLDPATTASELLGEATGPGTSISRALASALEDGAASLSSIVVVSDGRETSGGTAVAAAMRARGRGTTVHVVAAGARTGVRDVSLKAAPKRVIAFRGQRVRIGLRASASGMGSIRPTARLFNKAGDEIAHTSIEVSGDGVKDAAFDVDPPSVAEEWSLKLDALDGEMVASNNEDTVAIDIMDDKMRVLLLEGAPYWDSKFLARLLRDQAAVEILTIHRLNEDRYFRVADEGAELAPDPDALIPSSVDALAQYDLIVFGKGAEGFVTPQRAAAWRGFVADRGGAILFARGKAYAGSVPELEALEPVEWQGALDGHYRFVPSDDAGMGLFGGALPAGDHEIWKSLEPLDDVFAVQRLKSFARVAATGDDAGGGGRETPLLITRRFGNGMVALVNGDGLWRWSFKPSEEGGPAVFGHFWVQLMQWCAMYSDFRPGEDFAVRVDQPEAAAGEGVRATVFYRGTKDPSPRVRVYKDGTKISEAAATQMLEGETRAWVASVRGESPGRYEVRVVETEDGETEQGSALFRIPEPPSELADLRPNLELLREIAASGGGKLWTPEDTPELVKTLWAQDEAIVRSKPRWQSLWPTPHYALLLCALLGAEWWTRRRMGLK